MKQHLTALVVAAGTIGLVGCGSGTPGGPGASNKDPNKPSVTMADDSFSLTVPMTSTHIKQGEQKIVDIGIKRGKNFDQDVALKMDGVPTGVTADPSSPTIKHGEEKVQVTLKAKDDAAIGDFKVKLTGHPTKGADATNDLSLTVEKK